MFHTAGNCQICGTHSRMLEAKKIEGDINSNFSMCQECLGKEQEEIIDIILNQNKVDSIYDTMSHVKYFKIIGRRNKNKSNCRAVNDLEVGDCIGIKCKMPMFQTTSHPLTIYKLDRKGKLAAYVGSTFDEVKRINAKYVLVELKKI